MVRRAKDDDWEDEEVGQKRPAKIAVIGRPNVSHIDDGS